MLAGVMALGLVACGGSSDSAAESKVPANTVHSVDDLPGKTIGVQLGTTGDIYASDYEAEGSTNAKAGCASIITQSTLPCFKDWIASAPLL